MWLGPVRPVGLWASEASGAIRAYGACGASGACERPLVLYKTDPNIIVDLSQDAPEVWF